MATTSRFAGLFIFPVGDENPRRKGSIGHKSHAIIRRNPGLSFEDYLAKGGVLASLQYDYDRGFVETRTRRPTGKAKPDAKATAAKTPAAEPAKAAAAKPESVKDGSTKSSAAAVIATDAAKNKSASKSISTKSK